MKSIKNILKPATLSLTGILFGIIIIVANTAPANAMWGKWICWYVGPQASRTGYLCVYCPGNVCD